MKELTKSEIKRKAEQKVSKKYIYIEVSGRVLRVPVDILKERRGVEKTVMNHITPFVKKCLAGRLNE